MLFELCSSKQIMATEIQYILYNMPDDGGKVQVVIRDESIWCTQKAMAQLFGVERSVITKHLKNIFDTQELDEETVCAKIAHTAEDGKTYQTKFYHLAKATAEYDIFNRTQHIDSDFDKAVFRMLGE